MKYDVTVYFSGSVDISVDAETEKDATALAMARFDALPAIEIEANVFDYGVSECNETEDDEEEDDEI